MMRADVVKSPLRLLVEIGIIVWMGIYTTAQRANSRLIRFFSTVASDNDNFQVSGAYAYLQSAVSETDLTTYTFASQSLGAADATRLIIVFVAARGTGAPTLNSVTVGGVSGTIYANQSVDDSGPNNITAFAVVAVPSGTTGDIVLTFSGGMVRCFYAAWRVIGYASATPTDTDIKGPLAAPILSIDVPTNGVVFAGSSMETGSSPTCSWTNVTERFDDATTTDSFSGGDASVPAGETARSITANWSAGTIGIASAIALQLNP